MQKGAQHSARDMAAERGVHLKRVAQGACMGVLYFVSATVGARDVPQKDARGVREGRRVIAFVTVEGRGANMKVVGRVHKAAPTIANRMVEASDVLGSPVRSLLGASQDFVLHIVSRCKRNVLNAPILTA